jgi:hypothetical protein
MKILRGCPHVTSLERERGVVKTMINNEKKKREGLLRHGDISIRKNFDICIPNHSIEILLEGSLPPSFFHILKFLDVFDKAKE